MNKINFEINVADYLSADEIKEIVKNAVVDATRREINDLLSTEEDIRRVLVNTAYTFIGCEVDKILPNYRQTIAEKVKALIGTSDLRYEVFNKKDVWQKEDSLGTQYVKDAVKDNKGIIFDRIKNTITDYDVRSFIESAFNDSLDNLSEKFQGVADMIYNLKKDK